MKDKIIVTCGLIIIVSAMYLVGLAIYEIWVHFDWENASGLTAVFSIFLAYIVGWTFNDEKEDKK